jgi:hypothetical protein
MGALPELSDRDEHILAGKLGSLRFTATIQPEAAARCRDAFLSQVDALPQPSLKGQRYQAVSIPVFRRLNGWRQSLPSLMTRKERSPMFTTLALLVVSISLLFGGAGATAYAAQGSLPGEGLYAVKLWSEQTRLNLATDPEALLELNLLYATRRVEEMRRLAAMGEPAPEALQLRLEQQLDQSLSLAAGLEVAQMKLALEQMRAELQNQERILAGIPEGVDPVMIRMRQTIQERLRLAEDGLKDPEQLRERLREREKLHIHRTSTPAGTPQGTPGPHSSVTPPGGPAIGPGACNDGTCTPNEYEHDYQWETPGPHGDSHHNQPTQEPPAGNGNGNPDPEPSQAPGGGHDDGGQGPAQTEPAGDGQHGSDQDSQGGSADDDGGHTGGHTGENTGGGGGKP